MTQEKIGISDAIEKLIELTRNRKMEWKKPLVIPSHLVRADLKINSIFVSKYADKNILIAELKRRMGDYSEASWSDEIVLEFVDILDNPEWQFPDNVKIWDLLEVIKWQVAQVDLFLKKLFDEKQ